MGITVLNEGDERGELHVLLTTGLIIHLNDITQDEAMFWCDWIADKIEDSNEYGNGWTNFNADLVVGFDWVKYGSDVEHMF